MKPTTVKRTAAGAGLLLALFLLGGSDSPARAQENLGRGRISGTVVDESGAPVEGALVDVELPGSKTKLKGESDKKGRFSVIGLGTGRWQVTASKKGYISSSVTMDVSQLSSNPPVTLTLKKASGLAALATNKESQKEFEEGIALLDQGDYDQALKVFEAFSAEYPALYQVHLNIGTCYLKKGELDKAEVEFKLVLDKSLAAHGDYRKDAAAAVRAFSGLGEIAMRKGDLETAKKDFNQVLEISPEDAVAAYNVGEILFSNQQVDEAIRYFELAARIKKDWPKPYLRLGYAYLNKGNLDQALDSFNTFIRLDPESPDASQVKNIIATIEKMKK